MSVTFGQNVFDLIDGVVEDVFLCGSFRVGLK